MATTRIIAMHKNKGKSVSQCLKARIAYAVNPDKTDEGLYVTSYVCTPETADKEFLLTKREYRTLTGRTQEHDVIAYQFRQSFRPGEITPEEANQIGYELAERLLKGEHAFIVATHVDRQHIHNHIIWNSTALDATHKFRDFKESGLALQKLSDMICVEHGKSIIEHPKGKGKTYDRWLGDRKKLGNRDQLRQAIDRALEAEPKSMEELFELLQKDGYEIKEGKQPSFRKSGQKRFMRLDTLGEDYTKEALEKAFTGEKTVNGNRRQRGRKRSADSQKVSLLIDVEKKLQEGKGIGYQRWAKIFNSKQLAKTITYLSEHNLGSLEELQKRTDQASGKTRTLLEKNRELEQKVKDVSQMRAHVLQYLNTKEAFAQYKASGYSKTVYAKYEQEINQHREAKKYFNAQGVMKLPSVQSLQNEFVELQKEKREFYKAYREARDEMRDLLTVKENVERILHEQSVQEKSDKNYER